MPGRKSSAPSPAARRGGWKWWSVRVLVRITCADPADVDDDWDHSILLVKARNESEARRRGARAARRHDTSYIGGTGFRVRWRFDRVLECWELLDDPEDGAEVYSRLATGRGRTPPGDPMDEWSASRRRERRVLRDSRRR